MASAVAYQTIRTQLAAQLAPMALLDFEDFEPALQEGVNPFWVLEDDFSGEYRETYGCPDTAQLREDGGLWLHLMVPITQDLQTARGTFDAARAQLRWLSLANGIQLRDVAPAEAAPMNDGRWTVLSAYLEYEMRQRALLP